ncbi:MAG: NBR1-Ig-like domain-containing protein [Chloroflexota bacterium]
MRLAPALLALSLLLSACITVETKTPPPLQFVTSTLPPRPTAFLTATETPVVVPTLPRPANCKDAAVLIMDVTIPDGTRLAPGESFTKTWRLRNMGTCPWDGRYTLAFIDGERMGAPDSIPVPVTAPKADADISVELVAPSKNGSYAGYFELRDLDGQVIPIGLERSIWLKITVGPGAPAPTNGDVTAVPNGTLPVRGGSSTLPSACAAGENAGFVSQLLDLINAARREANLHALTVNAQLSAAAQGHARDMACNNLRGHIGSNGSDIGQRIRAAGYVPSAYIEIIAFGTPQDAMNQWQADAVHWEAVLNSRVTEIGIGYAYFAQSEFGGYFTVDLAAP